MTHLDRIQAPPIADFVIDVPLKPEVVETASGVKIHIMENTVQPVVRVEFVFRAGKWYQSKAGVASLTAKILKEGTIHKTAKEIADITDFYGASFDINHGFDRSTITLYCLSKFLPDLLPLLQEIIVSPAFPEEEFALLKQRVIQSLAVDKQKNSYLSSELFTTSIYGKEHPYANLITEEEIAAIELKDLADFHASAYSLSSAEVFVTGDLQSEPRDLLLGMFEGGVKPEKKKTHEPAKENPDSQPILVRESSSNNMQASIRIGKPIISPEHEDYPALYLANHALGGYFGSRLMKNIREDKGFTYGIYSSLSVKERGALFTIGTDIKGDKVAETLQEVEKEISTLSEKEIPDDEFITVKKHLAGKFISDASTVFDKMDRYKGTVLLRLPNDFYTTLQEKIVLLSQSEVKAAVRKHLANDALFKTVVGGI